MTQAPIIPRNSAKSDSRTIWGVGEEEKEVSVIHRWWEEEEERACVQKMEEMPLVFRELSNEKGLQCGEIMGGELSDATRTWYWTRTFVG